MSTSSHLYITLMPYGRRIVYTIALLWGLCLYYYVAVSYPTVQASLTALQRYFGFTALTLLYIVLLPGLINVYFPSFRGNGFLIKIRRAIGVSLFSFACLHVLLGFFVNLSGSVQAVLLLPDQNQFAIVFGLIAFTIFFLMAVTSFDVMVRKLGGKRWKMLHRMIYIAGISVVFHAFFIGSHFTNPKSLIPLLVNIATLTIILLEIGATLKRLSRNRNTISESRFAFAWIGLGCIALLAFYFSFRGITQAPFDPHAEHMITAANTYELRLGTQGTVDPGEEVETTFAIIDGKNGETISDFDIVHEKLLHLIVIKSDLTSYQHLHPEKNGDTFIQSMTYPSEGIYNLYTEFQPRGGSQGIAISKQQVGLGTEKRAKLTVTPRTQQFGDYQVVMNPQGISVGRTSYITFTIRDNKTGRPLTDLEPYLGAFGHLVIVSEDTTSYLHVHPSESITDPRQRGGPMIQFVTRFENGGKYKLFLQFQHKGKIQLVEYVIEVK